MGAGCLYQSFINERSKTYEAYHIAGFGYNVFVVGCTNTAVLSANTSSAKATTPPKQTSATSNAVTLPEEYYVLKDQKDVIAKEKYSKDMTKGFEYNEMYLYYKTDFFELKNEKATVELYIDSEVEEDGTLFIQDSQAWSLLVRQGDYVYPLILKEIIFIGQIKYALSIDDQQIISILAFFQTNTGMYMYEYQFDDKEEVFKRKVVYETTNENLGYYYSEGDIPYIPKY